MDKEQLEKKLKAWKRVTNAGAALALGSLLGMMGVAIYRGCVEGPIDDAKNMESRIGQCFTDSAINQSSPDNCYQIIAEYRELKDSDEYQQAVEKNKSAQGILLSLMPVCGIGIAGLFIGSYKRNKYHDKLFWGEDC